MKLSEETITVLRNFAAIQPNLLVREGSTISTISEAKNIIAEATFKENFDQQFGVYDLKEFLNCVDLIGSNHDLDVKDDHVKISGKGTSVSYYFTDPELLTVLSKKIKMPSEDVKFTLTQSMMDQLRKAASTLGHSSLVIYNDEETGTLRAKITDTADEKNRSVNSYDLDLNVEQTFTSSSFRFIMNISNLKLLPGDYDVALSSKAISEFKSKTLPVTYWVALEKKSEYKEL